MSNQTESKMKKLLAIAVTAALTAPMAASADTSVYGSARMLLGTDSPATLSNNSSRFGLKGSNTLSSGLTMTHKFEFGADPTGSAGAVSNRSSYIGFKAGFGEVRLGSDWTPLDDIDGGAGVLTNGGERLKGTDGDRKGSIKYLGKFGPVGVLASYIPKGNQVGTKAQLAVSYKAGPIYAALGTDSNNGANNPLVAALAYNGANYRVGYVYGKSAAGVKSNSFRGKYNFGSAYVAAEYTKQKGGLKQTDFEVGTKLGKGTKVYLQHKKTSGSSSNTALGVQHDF